MTSGVMGVKLRQGIYAPNSMHVARAEPRRLSEKPSVHLIDSGLLIASSQVII